jgi:RanBP1 domain/Nucleoporin FG repeat region
VEFINSGAHLRSAIDMSESMNAAQLASRKIKSAKGVRAKLGNRALPSAGAFGVNGTQPFQGQDASSGGGLFGGGLNASGTFNFSAPVKGISFGNNSETSTPFWGSDAEEDRRTDPTAEEVERRNKPFRMADGSAGASSQPFSSTFQRTPLSALGQPNGLGSVQEAAKPNPFQVSRSQSPAVAPPFNFGATSTQEQQPASNIFSFGQNSQAAPANNAFRFGTPPAVQEKPAGNVFSFNQTSSQAQPVSTGVSFGSTTTTTTTDKPASGIFSFGQTSAHPQQPSSSAMSFNPTPALVNIFGNSNTSNSTPVPNLFGQSNQQSTSSSNVFSNLNSQATVTNGVFSNQNQESATPTKSLFGDTVPKLPSTNPFFGGSNQQSAPTSSIFANLNQASTSSSSLFGTAKPQPAPSSNVFGVQKEQLAPTSDQFSLQEEQSAPTSNLVSAQQDGSVPTGNLFGAQKEQIAPAGNLFGGQKEQPAPTNNLFGSQQLQSTPAGSLFGGAKSSDNPFSGQLGSSSSIFANKPSTSTSSIFGDQAPQSNAPTNFFANLNKPTAQVNNESADPTTDGTSQNANGESGLQNGDDTNRPPTSPERASAAFQSTSSTFGSADEPEAESVLPSIEVEGPLIDNDVLSRLENETPTQPTTSNIFSSMKPTEAAKAPTNTNAFTNANVARSSSSPSKSSSNRAPAPINGISTTKDNELARLQNYYSEMGEVPDSVIEEKCPKHFSDAQKIQFFAAYRLRSLNKGIKQYIDGAELGADFSPAFHHYIERREEILEACATGLNNLKRRHDELQDEVENQDSNPKKKVKPSETTGAIQHVPRKSSPLKTQPVLNSFQLDQPTSPEKRSRPEVRQPSMSPTKKAQPSVNGSTTPKAPPPSNPLFPIQQPVVPASPSPRGKRKAEVQIDKRHPTEEEAIEASYSSKWHAPNGSKPGSATSSVFKSILDSPSQPASGSPEKKMFSLNKTQSADKPNFNPGASLPMPPDSPFVTSPSAQPSTSSSVPTVNMFAPKSGTQASSLFPAKPTDSILFSATSVNSGTGQTSSNLFAPRASTQASSLPKAASTPGEASAPSPPHHLAPKEGSSTSSIFSPKPATASTSIFTAKPTSTPTASNPFAQKPAPAATNSASSSEAEAKTIKPPTFESAPTNFLAQFGQKSKKSMADAEAEAMEKAKEEDMDSDEDEAEWEAKYKEKRAAEKKAVEELAKSKRATFVPGKGFTFDNAQPAPDAEKSAAKSIFNQTSAPFSSGSNLFAHINRSEASSPGAASSRASSVFDGPPKPAPFGSHNIFGHLSDVDSGADSGKGNDADDDTTDGESADSNGEQDDEKKDTTYDPSAEDAARPGTPGTPGTPVEETGPGIASAKKPTTIFNFNSSNSGTSTPASGGSLFDRISKDPNGNPIRQIPAENKENAGPGTASIFSGTIGKPFTGFSQKATTDENKSAQDNTWKPDSPIRFGASTTSPPTVNVTAPTPTKPTPFAGLFGSNAPPTPTSSPFPGVFGNIGSAKPSSPAPFAGIFGNSGTPKPASGLFAHLSDNKLSSVGFGFGSTTGSSLLPSTVGSAATSRATSPGGTTDGESNNENIDPEAEHHEQIDLTSGGPGEENEEVVHQVRAKALKFEPSKDAGGKSDWVVKGLGPLRVLKNKETGSSRVLLRADPSGTIVLNKGILGNVTYTATGKTLKLLTAGDGGHGLETWLLQVKTPAGAEELAGVLEANKRKE